jgi:RNA polymerase II elongation factor ELL
MAQLEAKRRALRKPLLHLLALGPQSEAQLLRKLNVSRDDLKPVLEKVGRKEPADTKYKLWDRAYKELDVWVFPYRHAEQRQTAIDNAIRAFDRQRVPHYDKLWQMLLPEHERGKGKVLSRLNLANGPQGMLRPPAGDSSVDDNGTRSVPAYVPTHQRPSMKELNKRLAGKKPKAASQPQQQPKKAAEPKAAETKAKAGASGRKTKAQPKSSEYVHDSDDEERAEKPKGQSAARKPKAAEAGKADAAAPKAATKAASKDDAGAKAGAKTAGSRLKKPADEKEPRRTTNGPAATTAAADGRKKTAPKPAEAAKTGPDARNSAVPGGARKRKADDSSAEPQGKRPRPSPNGEKVGTPQPSPAREKPRSPPRVDRPRTAPPSADKSRTSPSSGGPPLSASPSSTEAAAAAAVPAGNSGAGKRKAEESKPTTADRKDTDNARTNGSPLSAASLPSFKKRRLSPNGSTGGGSRNDSNSGSGNSNGNGNGSGNGSGSVRATSSRNTSAAATPSSTPALTPDSRGDGSSPPTSATADELLQKPPPPPPPSSSSSSSRQAQQSHHHQQQRHQQQQYRDADRESPSQLSLEPPELASVVRLAQQFKSLHAQYTRLLRDAAATQLPPLHEARAVDATLRETEERVREARRMHDELVALKQRVKKAADELPD